jgi:putative transposase
LSGGIESAVTGNHFPVKHRIVDAPKDWPYSTFHRYVEKGMYSPGWGATPTEFPVDIGGE